MNSGTKKILIGGALLFFIGCAGSSQEKAKSVDMSRGYTESAAMDSTVAPSDNKHEDFASSSAAVENKKDTLHKFVRTADLKFKVKNTIKATYEIEDITARFNGFVTYTNLNSSIDNKRIIPVTLDSSIETTFYTVQNEMTLRVPNTQLDTTLKTIAKLIDFLDYRVIKADDVALQLLSNQMTQSRVAKHEERLINAIDNRGKKLNETTNAEENLLNKQEQSDNAKIANMTLKDQISYSTITLNIYQRQSMRMEKIASNRSVEAYEPGFGLQFKDSVKFGWDMLQAVFIFLVKMWGLVVFGVVAFVVVKVVVKKMKK
jgi:hypothetical protein